MNTVTHGATVKPQTKSPPWGINGNNENESELAGGLVSQV